MNDTQIASIVYEILQTQTFADWYGSDDDSDNSSFGNHIRGYEDAKSRAIIKGEISNMIKEARRIVEKK